MCKMQVSVKKDARKGVNTQQQQKYSICQLVNLPFHRSGFRTRDNIEGHLEIIVLLNKLEWLQKRILFAQFLFL